MNPHNIKKLAGSRRQEEIPIPVPVPLFRFVIERYPWAPRKWNGSSHFWPQDLANLVLLSILASTEEEAIVAAHVLSGEYTGPGAEADKTWMFTVISATQEA